MRRAAFALAALALARAACAGPATDTVSLRVETSRLDHGYASWQEQGLSWRRAWAPGHGLALDAATVRRFGLDDRRLSVDYSQPLARDLDLSLEATWSPDHQVLARTVAGARLAWKVRPQWVAYVGARASDHAEGLVRHGTLALEHYLGDFSVSASWMPVQALGASTSSASLRADWYYGDRRSVGLIAASGREATRVGPATLVLADVRAVALVGRHALAGPWGLAWSLERTHQGTFYTRTGASVALQHAF